MQKIPGGCGDEVKCQWQCLYLISPSDNGSTSNPLSLAVKRNVCLRCYLCSRLIVYCSCDGGCCLYHSQSDITDVGGAFEMFICCSVYVAC